MAMRIRTVKPEFWAHPVLARLPADTQLMALALISLADDHGYFEADARVVRGSVMPFRDDLSSIDRDIDALVAIGFVELRHHEGRRFGFVVKFRLHQRVERPKPSKLKEYFDAGRVTERSVNDQGSITDASPIDHGCVGDRSPQEGNGSGRDLDLEGNGEANAKHEATKPPEPAPAQQPQPEQAALLEVPSSDSKPHAQKTEKQLTFVQRLHAEYCEQRDLKLFELTGDLDPPPDDPPNWTKTSLVAQQWLDFARKAFPDDDVKGNEQCVRAFVLNFLETPWGAGLMKRDAKGKPTNVPQPFPWHAVTSEQVWRKLADDYVAEMTSTESAA